MYIIIKEAIGRGYMVSKSSISRSLFNRCSRKSCKSNTHQFLSGFIIIKWMAVARLSTLVL